MCVDSWSVKIDIGCVDIETGIVDVSVCRNSEMRRTIVINSDIVSSSCLKNTSTCIKFRSLNIGTVVSWTCDVCVEIT